MNKKIIIIMIILLSLSFLSCVEAKDLNNTTADSLLTNDNNHELISIDKSNENTSLQITSEDNLSADKQSSANLSSAYLVIDNDADKENILIGEYVTWLIDVENRGPDTAKNVKIYDQLPDGLKFIRYEASQGKFNPKTGIWDIGNLPNHACAWLHIITQAITAGEKINKANITSDTINLNNETYEEEEIDVLDNENKVIEKKYYEDTLKATGNPIGLILLSLISCLICFVKKIR